MISYITNLFEKVAARVGYGNSDSQPHSVAKQPRLHAFHGVYVIFAFLLNVQVRGMDGCAALVVKRLWL